MYKAALISVLVLASAVNVLGRRAKGRKHAQVHEKLNQINKEQDSHVTMEKNKTQVESTQQNTASGDAGNQYTQIVLNINPGSSKDAKYARQKWSKTQFLVPLWCRNSGYFLHANSIFLVEEEYSCIKVTCREDGTIGAEVTLGCDATVQKYIQKLGYPSSSWEPGIKIALPLRLGSHKVDSRSGDIVQKNPSNRWETVARAVEVESQENGFFVHRSLQNLGPGYGPKVWKPRTRTWPKMTSSDVTSSSACGTAATMQSKGWKKYMKEDTIIEGCQPAHDCWVSCSDEYSACEKAHKAKLAKENAECAALKENLELQNFLPEPEWDTGRS